MTIWKYQFAVEDEVVLRMPRGATVLSVQTQDGRPCLWALVDPQKPTVDRRFELYGTGHPVQGLVGKHVGTFQMHGGALVFHMFE